jgi:pantothenate kinase
MIHKDFSLRENGHLSRYLVFSRQEWAQLRNNTPLTLSQESVQSLCSLNDPISLQEVEHIYLPLSRLLQLNVAAVQKLYTFTLCQIAFRDPSSYFTRFANLSTEQAIATARSIWQEINSPNLRQNILPSRERANLILSKGKENTIQPVKLPKL